MTDTVNIPSLMGGALEISRADAVAHAARLAAEFEEAAHWARSPELRELMTQRAMALKALTYFAVPVRTEYFLTADALSARLAISPSVIAAYRNGGADVVDAVLRDVRAELLQHLSKRTHGA